MSILGIDEITYGASDLTACRRFMRWKTAARTAARACRWVGTWAIAWPAGTTASK